MISIYFVSCAWRPKPFSFSWKDIMSSSDPSLWHPTRVYVFGDQTHDVAKNLSSLLNISTQEPILQDFLENSCKELRNRLSTIPAAELGSFPKFSSFRELVLLSNQCPLPSLLCPAVTCIYQIGFIIGYASHLHTLEWS